MKINRVSCNEDYNITVPWLRDFAHQLEKKSYNNVPVSNLSTLDKKPAFNTIEEKMADIKQRIGFDLITTIKEEDGLDNKTASAKCGCNSDCCSLADKVAADNKMRHDEEDVKLMGNILNYIKDMIRHEHDKLSTDVVISRCREEPNLYFDHIPINMSKLRDFIDNKLECYQGKKTSREDSNYIPLDKDLNNMDENKEAEYWSHAFPNRM